MEVIVKRPRGRPRKRRRPEEENESAVADTKSNNSKTKKTGVGDKIHGLCRSIRVERIWGKCIFR